MQGSSFKIIFIILIIVLIIGAIYINFFDKEEIAQAEEIVKSLIK